MLLAKPNTTSKQPHQAEHTGHGFAGHGFAGPSDMDMDMHTKTRELQTQLYRMLILPPSSWLGSAVQLQQLRRANAILRGMACPKDLPSRAVATP